LQGLRKLGRHVHPAGFAVFRRRRASCHAIASDVDKPPMEIDISPLESKEFPKPHAGP